MLFVQPVRQSHLFLSLSSQSVVLSFVVQKFSYAEICLFCLIEYYCYCCIDCPIWKYVKTHNGDAYLKNYIADLLYHITTKELMLHINFIEAMYSIVTQGIHVLI
jgi:hypothetical protein